MASKTPNSRRYSLIDVILNYNQSYDLARSFCQIFSANSNIFWELGSQDPPLFPGPLRPGRNLTKSPRDPFSLEVCVFIPKCYNQLKTPSPGLTTIFYTRYDYN